MYGVSVSPDAQRVAFTLSTARAADRLGTHRVDSSDLWVCDIATRSAHRVAATNQTGWQALGPSWAPDSKQLVCSGYTESGAHGLFVVDIKGSRFRVLVESSKWRYGKPDWAPDGSRVCVTRSVDFGDEPRAELVTIRPDGDEMKVVYGPAIPKKHRGPSACIEDPRWSPESELISFWSSCQGDYETVVIDATDGSVASRRGGTLHRWIGPREYSVGEAQSLDDAHLVFAVFIVDALTGETVSKISPPDGLDGVNLPSPAGDLFLFREVRPGGNPKAASRRVVVRRTDGERTGQSVVIPADDECEWLPDSSGLVVWSSGFGRGAPKIMIAKFDSDTPRVIVGVDEKSLPSFTSSDAWIFLSVAMASKTKPVPLDRVIGNADAINHSIPARQEIESGANRLASAGVLLVSGLTFELTEKGRAVYRRARRGYALETWRRVHEELESLEVDVDEADWRLSDDDFRRSFAMYHDRFQKILRNIEKLDPLMEPVRRLLGYLGRRKRVE